MTGYEATILMLCTLTVLTVILYFLDRAKPKPEPEFDIPDDLHDEDEAWLKAQLSLAGVKVEEAPEPVVETVSESQWGGRFMPVPEPYKPDYIRAEKLRMAKDYLIGVRQEMEKTPEVQAKWEINRQNREAEEIQKALAYNERQMRVSYEVPTYYGYRMVGFDHHLDAVILERAGEHRKVTRSVWEDLQVDVPVRLRNEEYDSNGNWIVYR